MEATTNKMHTPVLTVTGSDSTSVSGIQADIKTINALGAYAMTVITSVTVQNTLGIQHFYDLPPDIVAGQIDAIINDMQPQIVKIGMIRRTDVMQTIAHMMRSHPTSQIIYDPVVMSSQGDILMSNDVVCTMRSELLPRCSLVVMKAHDAQHILGYPVDSITDAQHGATDLLRSGCAYALIHGIPCTAGLDTNLLFKRMQEGQDAVMVGTYQKTNAADSHGISGALSASIAAFLSKGENIPDAVAHAVAYIESITESQSVLAGRGSQLYRDFLSEITAHYATHGDVRFYAEQLNVSSTYLAQVTRRIASKTPKAIIDE